MTSPRHELDRRYKDILRYFNNRQFKYFYNSIYDYIDFVEKQEKLLKSIGEDRKETADKKQKVFSNNTLSKWDKRGLIRKIERYSVSEPYDTAHDYIYLPMKEYRQLLVPISENHARGCALSSDEEIRPIFLYLVDIFVFWILRQKVDRLFSYYRLIYIFIMSGYMKRMEQIHKGLEKMMIENISKAIAPQKTEFDRDNSILKIGGREVLITIKNDKTNAHYVLEYIFDKGTKEKAYYTDILEEKFFNNSENQMSMYRACNNIQEKVRKQAKIENFLEIHTGKTGWVKINSIYA